MLKAFRFYQVEFLKRLFDENLHQDRKRIMPLSKLEFSIRTCRCPHALPASHSFCIARIARTHASACDARFDNDKGKSGFQRVEHGKFQLKTEI